MCEIRIHVHVLEVQLCVAVELEKEENFCEKTEGPNPAGLLAGLLRFLRKIKFGLCLKSGRIVTWHASGLESGQILAGL